jgi:hypothetical protein
MRKRKDPDPGGPKFKAWYSYKTVKYSNITHVISGETVFILSSPICRDIQWSTGDDTPGMGDEIEAAYEDFLRGQS